MTYPPELNASQTLSECSPQISYRSRVPLVPPTGEGGPVHQLESPSSARSVNLGFSIGGEHFRMQIATPVTEGGWEVLIYPVAFMTSRR